MPLALRQLRGIRELLGVRKSARNTTATAATTIIGTFRAIKSPYFVARNSFATASARAITRSALPLITR